MRIIKYYAALGATVALMALALAWRAYAAEAPDPEFLFKTVAALDRDAFDAFNRCSDPIQLKKHEGYFSPVVEFYHDTGGVTWTRDAMLENTKKFVCGNYRRELIVGTLRVYPIKDFGAIAQGTHRFCDIADGKCEGLADFTIIWEAAEGKWRMTRVLSYGHRPNNSPAESSK